MTGRGDNVRARFYWILRRFATLDDGSKRGDSKGDSLVLLRFAHAAAGAGTGAIATVAAFAIRRLRRIWRIIA